MHSLRAERSKKQPNAILGADCLEGDRDGAAREGCGRGQAAEDEAAGPIFHDCLLSEHGLASIHIHLREIVYPPSVQERIVLVHYGDDVKEHLPAIREAGLKITFPGEVIRLSNWRSCVH